MRIVRRWLFLTHRWLGIAACLLFLTWFVSGAVMLYVPYPSITPAERLAAAQAMDWGQVRVAPAEALRAAEVAEFPKELRLEMSGPEPVYRITAEDRSRMAVSAATGKRIDGVTPGEAALLAAAFAKAPVLGVLTLERDQWTVAQGFDPHRPLHRVAVDDGVGSWVYVSALTGEVVQAATRSERAWNWVGAVPHWLYLTAIRKSPALWRDVVLWTSGPAIIVAVTGFWIGLLRLRAGERRYRGGAFTPYRAWMRWHHLLGLVGGSAAIIWMASGWLSVNPLKLFSRDGLPEIDRRWTGHERADFTAIDRSALAAAAPGARQILFTHLDAQPLAIALEASPATARALDPATGVGLHWSDDTLTAHATRVGPGNAARAERLIEPDVYWYSHWRERPLPVLRIKFDDLERTWLHVDPTTGTLLGQMNQDARVYRWLFSFLHNFDLPVLLANRWLRDPIMLLMLAVGSAMSMTALVIAWRRLRYSVSRTRGYNGQLRVGRGGTAFRASTCVDHSTGKAQS